MVYTKKIFILFLISFSLKAAEVDQFTKRHIKLEDSAEYLNQKANRELDQVISKLNQRTQNCSDQAFFKEMQQSFNNHLEGEFVKEIEVDKNIDTYYVNLKESIYKDWRIWNGALLGSSVLMNKKFTMSKILRVGDVYLGIDKFEHLFGQGFAYYKSFYIKGKTDYKTILVGYRKEKLVLGGGVWVNGVFSYGDLVANFNGMRFWNSFFQRNSDIFGTEFNRGPFVSCQKSKWQKENEIDFRDFFDHGVDESINCARTGTKSGAVKMREAVSRLGLKCPIDSNLVIELKNKYRDFSPLLINSVGIKKINL